MAPILPTAAVAGKDELKQAARRVREARRKPRAEPATQAGETVGAGEGALAAGGSEELDALRQRVKELSAENEALRKQVANLLQQLVG